MMIIILIGDVEICQMGRSQAAKAMTRELILAEASRQLRAGGLESVSIGAVMKRAGLTHGGFYGHFGSREALVVEALERALQEGGEKTSVSGETAAFSAIVSRYLSLQHRDSRESGCAVAALVSDVARADTASRKVMTEQVDAFIEALSKALGDDEERAIFAVSAMVGALTLSRVVVDSARSNAVLTVVRDRLEALDSGDLS